MFRTRLGLASLALVVMCVAPSSVNAYTLNPYNSSYFDNEDTNCQCIAASVRMELMYIDGTTAVTAQSTINSYAQAHDLLTTTCGSDPQGWAYAMWNYSPAGYGFNSYSSTSQTAQDWELVYGTRADHHPNGALVAAGRHAIDVVGFNTLNDPWADQTQTLYGFYLLDPWYGRGSSGLPNWPYNGFTPNSYVTVSSWNSLYFTANTNNTNSRWYNKYVVLLRSSTDAAPAVTPPQSYGDYMYSQLGLAASLTANNARSTATAQRTLAPANVSPTIAAAVETGLVQNDLIQGGSLGVDLREAKIGRSVHVDSLAREVPSYDLVEVSVGSEVRAVAMVTESPGGFSFSALTPWNGQFDLASPRAVDSALASQGMSGPAHFVWAWTDDGGSPFMPFIRAMDNGTAGPAYIGPNGKQSQIHLAPGLTAR